MAARKKRVLIAEKTFEEINNGVYFTSEGEEKSELGDLIKNATENSRIMYVSDLVGSHSCPDGKKVFVDFYQGTTVYTLKLIHTLYPSERIGLLNFASAIQPGGGFLTGAQAQEESLCRSSSLYDCLSPFDDTFYMLPQRNGVYSNACIISPQVPFFKDDNGEYWNDIICSDVVSIACVNITKFLPKTKSSRTIIHMVLKLRIRMILSAFEKLKSKTIILGAWGCGVFRNSIQEISHLFAKILKNYKSNCIERVIFAIPDSDTFVQFKSNFVNQETE